MKAIISKGFLLSTCAMLMLGAGCVASGPYEALSSSANKTSILAGSALRSNGTTGARDVATMSGSLEHAAGEIDLSDGAGGSETNFSDAGAADGYDYVGFFSQTSSTNGTTTDLDGVYGIVISADDMPNAGSATYTGESNALFVTPSDGFDLIDGTAEVEANFAAASVDVNIGGFTAINQLSDADSLGPIDQINIDGMTITGNSFQGGTITTLLDGSAVNLTGANTSSASQGHFFGINSAGTAPDEVGGMFLHQGASAILTGRFIAD